MQEKLDYVATKVREKLQEVSNRTLEKIKEMNPEVANSLHPKVPSTQDLKWADVFKGLSITGDEDIPHSRGIRHRFRALLSVGSCIPHWHHRRELPFPEGRPPLEPSAVHARGIEAQHAACASRQEACRAQGHHHGAVCPRMDALP